MIQFYICEFQPASGLPSVSDFMQIESKEERKDQPPHKNPTLRVTEPIVRGSVMFSKLCLHTLAS